jgi:hypothetical protein
MSHPNPSGGVTRLGGNGVTGRTPSPESLADVLERVLDKGVVVVGDIRVSLLDIELLTLKLRLFIASADTAREMGVDWWTSDPFYSSKGRGDDEQRHELEQRIAALEQQTEQLSSSSTRGTGARRGSQAQSRNRS